MTSAPPTGLVARSPVMADAEEVAALHNARSMAELGVPETTAAQIRKAWQVPGFDLARDALLVATPQGHPVGYMDLWGPAPYTRIYSDGCVHPTEQRRGIGAFLLQAGEERARQIMVQAPANARVTLIGRTLSTNERAQQLFRRAGYQLERHFWRMVITLDVAPLEPVLPVGLTMRTAVAGQDDRAIFEAIDEAFRDHYDHQSMPLATWLHWVKSDPNSYDPSLWFMAFDGEEVAGAVVCRPRLAEDPDMGWVDDLGVRRPWRRRGLGMALLRYAFAAFYRRGVRTVGLTVDAASLTGATRLYERAGMHVDRQYDRYAKELRPGDELSQESV